MFVAWCSHCEIRIVDVDEWVAHTTAAHRAAATRPLFTRTRTEPRWLTLMRAWDESTSQHGVSA